MMTVAPEKGCEYSTRRTYATKPSHHSSGAGALSNNYQGLRSLTR